MSDAMLHVDDTPDATADDAVDSAGHTNLELDRATLGMLAASEAIAKPRDAITRLLRPSTSGDAHVGASARRLLAVVAVFTAGTVAVALARSRARR